MQANSLKNANPHGLGLVQSHMFHLPTITYAHIIMHFSTWKTDSMPIPYLAEARKFSTDTTVSNNI
jgi:hypothetical protein